jgi:hypothetical protein
MSRSHQYVGLTKEAEIFLLANVEKIADTVCHKCGEIISTKPNIINMEHVDAFYGDGPDLATYKLKDGRIAKEIVQVQPWSSGPMSFICLEIEGQRYFEWRLVRPLNAGCGQEAEYINYEEGTYWA